MYAGRALNIIFFQLSHICPQFTLSNMILILDFLISWRRVIKSWECNSQKQCSMMTCMWNIKYFVLSFIIITLFIVFFFFVNTVFLLYRIPLEAVLGTDWNGVHNGICWWEYPKIWENTVTGWWFYYHSPYICVSTFLLYETVRSRQAARLAWEVFFS